MFVPIRRGIVAERHQHGNLLLACALAGTICALAAVSSAAHAQPGPAQVLVQKPQPAVSAARLEKAIHDLVNRERRSQGLKPLAWDAPLAVVARGHSKDMAGRNYFSHESPEGDGFEQRYRKGHYRCALRTGNVIHLGAENLARGTLYASVTTLNGVRYYDWNSEQKIAYATVAGWMASPGHRANILTAHWKHEGIGLIIGNDQRVYVTQNFC
jgi:uncharacterized protein YkwD